MKTLNPSQLQDFEQNGFTIARQLLDESEVQACFTEIEALFTDQGRKFNLLSKPPKDLDDVIRMVMRPNTPERGFVYDFVRNIRPLRAIETSPVIHGCLKQLGLKLPINFEIPSLRFDIPGENKFLTKKHQDIRSIRSKRCITIWFPLRPVSATVGSLAVYAGSHKFDLIEHVIVDRQIEIAESAAHTWNKCPKVIVEAGPRDVVFMNSFCVHESHPSQGTAIKINGQFFYNDALEMNKGDKYEALKAIPDYKSA